MYNSYLQSSASSSGEHKHVSRRKKIVHTTVVLLLLSTAIACCCRHVDISTAKKTRRLLCFFVLLRPRSDSNIAAVNQQYGLLISWRTTNFSACPVTLSASLDIVQPRSGYSMCRADREQVHYSWTSSSSLEIWKIVSYTNTVVCSVLCYTDDAPNNSFHISCITFTTYCGLLRNDFPNKLL